MGSASAGARPRLRTRSDGHQLEACRRNVRGARDEGDLAGGAAGLHIKGAELLTKVATEAEAIWTICAVTQLYREEAWYLERIYKWMDRVGLETIRAAVEDPERRRALYDRFAYSQRFYRIDPWAERVAGRHQDEFNPLSRRMEFEPA